MLPPSHAFIDPGNQAYFSAAPVRATPGTARPYHGNTVAPAATPYDPASVLATLPHFRPSKTVGPVQRIASHRANGRPIYHAPKWNGIGDARRIAFLRELAEQYGDDPRMRFFVVNNVLKPAGVESRDGRGAAAAILKWVQDNIYYANEKGEQLQIPWVTLEQKTGDCDDLNTLIGAMAMSIGLGWRQALAGKDPKTGQKARWIEPAPGDRKSPKRPPTRIQWSHIYPVLGWPALAPSMWASAEPTLPSRLAPLGYDVIVNGVPGGAAGRSTSDLGGLGAAGAASPAAQCGVCTCPGDADLEPDDRPWLARTISNIEWDMVLREVVVAVASTVAVSYVVGAAMRR